MFSRLELNFSLSMNRTLAAHRAKLISTLLKCKSFLRRGYCYSAFKGLLPLRMYALAPWPPFQGRASTAKEKPRGLFAFSYVSNTKRHLSRHWTKPAAFVSRHWTKPGLYNRWGYTPRRLHNLCHVYTTCKLLLSGFWGVWSNQTFGCRSRDRKTLISSLQMCVRSLVWTDL